MLLQTNSYIVPKDRRAEHARLLRRFRQILLRLGCDQFEVFEQMGPNWHSAEATGRFVQLMRFRDRKHQRAVHAAEQRDPSAQQLINEFCELINLPYQQQQGLLAIGYYIGVVEIPATAKGRAVAEEAECAEPEFPETPVGFGFTGPMAAAGNIPRMRPVDVSEEEPAEEVDEAAASEPEPAEEFAEAEAAAPVEAVSHEPHPPETSIAETPVAEALVAQAPAESPLAETEAWESAVEALAPQEEPEAAASAPLADAEPEVAEAFEAEPIPDLLAPEPELPELEAAEELPTVEAEAPVAEVELPPAEEAAPLAHEPEALSWDEPASVEPAAESWQPVEEEHAAEPVAEFVAEEAAPTVPATVVGTVPLDLPPGMPSLTPVTVVGTPTGLPREAQPEAPVAELSSPLPALDQWDESALDALTLDDLVPAGAPMTGATEPAAATPPPLPVTAPVADEVPSESEPEPLDVPAAEIETPVAEDLAALEELPWEPEAAELELAEASAPEVAEEHAHDEMPIALEAPAEIRATEPAEPEALPTGAEKEELQPESSTLERAAAALAESEPLDLDALLSEWKEPSAAPEQLAVEEPSVLDHVEPVGHAPADDLAIAPVAEHALEVTAADETAETSAEPALDLAPLADAEAPAIASPALEPATLEVEPPPLGEAELAEVFSLSGPEAGTHATEATFAAHEPTPIAVEPPHVEPAIAHAASIEEPIGLIPEASVPAAAEPLPLSLLPEISQEPAAMVESAHGVDEEPGTLPTHLISEEGDIEIIFEALPDLSMSAATSSFGDGHENPPDEELETALQAVGDLKEAMHDHPH